MEVVFQSSLILFISNTSSLCFPHVSLSNRRSLGRILLRRRYSSLHLPQPNPSNPCPLNFTLRTIPWLRTILFPRCQNCRRGRSRWGTCPSRPLFVRLQNSSGEWMYIARGSVCQCGLCPVHPITGVIYPWDQR